jgi:hypothetical protein
MDLKCFHCQTQRLKKKSLCQSQAKTSEIWMVSLHFCFFPQLSTNTYGKQMRRPVLCWSYTTSRSLQTCSYMTRSWRTCVSWAPVGRSCILCWIEVMDRIESGLYGLTARSNGELLESCARASPTTDYIQVVDEAVSNCTCFTLRHTTNDKDESLEHTSKKR